MALNYTALIDTRANGYGFISRNKAQEVRKLLRTHRIKLDRPVPITGYNGSDTEELQWATEANLLVMGRIEARVPFLEANLGRHDIILGRKWLADHRILVDCYRNRLI